MCTTALSPSCYRSYSKRRLGGVAMQSFGAHLQVLLRFFLLILSIVLLAPSIAPLLPFTSLSLCSRCCFVYADERVIEAQEEDILLDISDPFEGWNRRVFWLNDKLDRYLLEPVSDGYDYVMPDEAQRGITNFFDNLLYPTYLVSDLVQLKFSQALEHTGRFLVNSTVGIFGLIDVAQHVGLERHKEDFGLALGYHGVPAGPYLVFPFFGPSTVRDGFGFMVDTALNPVGWAVMEAASSNDAILITTGVAGVDIIQRRTNLDEAIEAARDASLDYYLFVQSAYYQRRAALIEDRQIHQPEEEDPFAEDEAFDEMFGE